MATRVSSIIPLLVITLCCIGIVEGGYMAFEYLVLSSKVRSESRRPETAETSLVGQGDTSKKYGYQVILTRNLFAAAPAVDAHRLTALVDNIDNLEATSLDIVLLGTINDNEGGNRAIIIDKKTLKQKIYRQGQDVQGATIKGIRRGKVILNTNGRDEVLDMSEAAKLRLELTTESDSQAAALQQDAVQADLANSTNTLEKIPAEELLQQQLLPSTSAVHEQSAKRVVRPVIIRPPRPPESH